MNAQQTSALEQAISWIEENFKSIAIIASGSIIRGNADANSDFDIYVIHEKESRQRIQKKFNGVPCEIFVNSLVQVHQYFETELKNNRPVTANMLSTGKIMKGEDNPAIQNLLEKAIEFSNKSPVKTEQDTLFARYQIATLFEDATDLLQTDRVTSAYFLDRTILECIDFAFLVNNKSLPRAKERIQLLQPGIQELIVEYYQLTSLNEKYEIATQLVRMLIGETGFFEWTSEP